MSSITVHPQLIWDNLAGVRSSGEEWIEQLHRVGLTEVELQSGSSRVPLDKAVILHRRMLDYADDETLGLLSRRTPRGLFRQMALSSVHTENLGAALQRMTDIMALIDNDLKFELLLSNGSRSIVITAKRAIKTDPGFVTAWLMGILHRFASWLCNDRVVPASVELAFPPPRYHRDLYYAFYGASTQFEASRNAVTYSTADLKRPVVQNEQMAESYIRRFPVDVLIPAELGGPVGREIRSRLWAHLLSTTQVLTLVDTASLLQRRPQNIRRALAYEGTSYKQISMQVRRDASLYFLGDPRLSVEQVAEKSGYADASSFVRVFKRWTGFTPHRFRSGF